MSQSIKPELVTEKHIAEGAETDDSVTSDPQPDQSPELEKHITAPGIPNDYPDGGARAWLVAVGTSFVLFSTMGAVNSWGVLQAYYQTHQLKDETPSAISWIGSMQVFFLFASGLVGGPLFDRFGAKVIRPAIVLYVFSFMMTSLCKKYWQFMLAQGFLNGVSNGMTMAPAMAVLPQYFNKKRGAAMGLAIAGSSMGGLVLPIVLAKMLYSPLGFGWTMRVLGFVFLFLLAFAGIVIRARLPPRASKFFLLSAFKDRPYVMLIIACWFALIGIFVPIFYLPIYAEAHGMRAELAAYLIAILNAASIFGRVIPGVLSDKLGRVNILASAALSSGILIFCWPSTKTNAAIIVFAALFGFCSGGVVSGMSVTMASCSPDPRNFGTYLGMGMPIISIATLISPPINGAFVHHFGDFKQAAYFSGAMTVLGGLIALSIKFVLPGGFVAKS